MDDFEKADLVIVGAGVNGLSGARTYLTINPSASVIILESAASIGGVWAQERLYEGLRLNNLLGTYEYSDFPMDERFGVKPRQHIPGTAAHEYLKAFAETFGLCSRIRLQSTVETIEKIDEKCGAAWAVTYLRKDEKDKANRKRVLTRKLIVATGLASEPSMPNFTGAESFDAPLFHNKFMAERHHDIVKSKRVVVLGGAKSGYDAAYLAATHGVEVDWVISISGKGAAWMMPPFITPFKLWGEKVSNTRFATWMSPSSWGDADGFSSIRKFLHGSSFGRWIVNGFWKALADDVIRANGYNEHPETRKLKPFVDAFWVGSGFSILNYPTNFYDLVREGKIRVHLSDVSHLSRKTVHLVGGGSLQADALISCTGWKSTSKIKFLPEGIDEKLGLPNNGAGATKLSSKADIETLLRFPRLQNRPRLTGLPGKISRYDDPSGEKQPYRLYRHLVPPAFIHERSIGFMGVVSNFSMVLCSQVQALWLTAYFDGKLPLGIPSPEVENQIRWDTIYNSQFGRWRYPFASLDHPDFIFDAVPYMDWLLRDLNLKVHRKEGPLAEAFSPYGPADYQGLIEEWREGLTSEEPRD